MYEVMKGWETDPSLADQAPVMADFARIWQAAHKIVYSKTLQSASTVRTRVESTLEAESIRQMKAELETDLAIGGPELASHAFKADLINEIHLLLAPCVLPVS